MACITYVLLCIYYVLSTYCVLRIYHVLSTYYVLRIYHVLSAYYVYIMHILIMMRQTDLPTEYVLVHITPPVIWHPITGILYKAG